MKLTMKLFARSRSRLKRDHLLVDIKTVAGGQRQPKPGPGAGLQRLNLPKLSPRPRKESAGLLLDGTWGTQRYDTFPDSCQRLFELEVRRVDSSVNQLNIQPAA